MSDIAFRTRRQEKLDRFSLSSHHQMEFEAIEVPSFTGNLAPILRFTIDSTSTDAPIIADWNWKGVNHANGISIESLPVVTQDFNEIYDEMSDPM